MTSLRDELGGRHTAPTPYGILCPPGWRRTHPRELLEGPATEAALARMKAAGRADLVLQTRSMLAQYRRSIEDLKVIELYLPPADAEAGPLPATLMVSPLVRPATVGWDAALGRLSRGKPVESADFAQTPMWLWRTGDSIRDEHATVATRETHYVVPVPGEEPSRRALRFQFTALAPDGLASDDVESLIALGDVMMSTMRWLDAPGAGRA
ncbi:hypothetical protein [Microbacterium hominis]|uniref:Uncharacterized protein n=1 Tax=Microbacterium hominis TaxID=162426 RepID=A0A7D4PP04_9MICO|nr:hypothetical protein [Microbacterium hominis]QKJ20695.1 hypothetical protein HQM25_15935 [Microbacterium hominis]